MAENGIGRPTKEQAILKQLIMPEPARIASTNKEVIVMPNFSGIDHARDLLKAKVEGLDADKLDGYHSTDFAAAAHTHSGRIHTSNISKGTAAWTTTSANYVDVTNPGSITLATTKTCTIYAWASIPHSISDINQAGAFQLMIDGTAQPPYRNNSLPSATSQFDCAALIGIKTGVGAGNIVIKLQAKITGGATSTIRYSDTNYVASFMAIAVEE